MGKIVQVKPGFTGVMLIPSMRGIDAGQQFTLTDAEYAALPSSVSRTVTIIQSGVTDPTRSAGAPQSLSETLAQAKAYADSIAGASGVASVNTRTGAVVLTADDTPDGTTNKAYSATEKTKLSGVATGATANSTDAFLLARGNHTGTESADALTDGTTNKAFLATERTKLTGISASAAANETSVLPLGASGAGAVLGTATTSARSDHKHPRYSWEPPDYGLLGWSFDGIMATSSTTPGAGQLQMVRIHVPVASSITNVIIAVVTLGATLTSGQNFMALFDSSRNLIGVTADRTTRWNTGGTTGMDEAALVGGPFAVAAGDYYVGFWSVGTTQPAIARAGNTGAINNKLSGNNSRHGTSSTGLTTTAPNPAAAITASNTAFWAAVS